ncbi:MAG: glycosyltransferase family 4 protein [Veillonellaceae bacterium]|nr:glycosyltransferase family 4 protein [Veillonellaceae bacterium]
MQEDEADIYLCLSHGFPLGGIEAFCLELYERLTRMGHRVKFLCLAEPYVIPSSVRKDVILFPKKDGFAENVQQALRFLKGVRDKIVVINYLRPVELAAIALQNVCRFRILSILHSDFESIYRNNAAFAPMVYAFVGVSDLACRRLVEAGVEASRIHSTTLPIAGPDVWTRSYAKEDAPIRIGYAGRIVQRPKRIDLQLELIRRLESAGIAYEYHFMGSGAYEDDVRAFIEREGIGDHVFLHPPCPRTKIGAFWQYMDVCISTSLWEGRGISILEAMMWGAVPVVTETAGAHQDIEDGRDGYIVPIGDVDAMTGRVLELAQHRGRLPVMGRNAHERVQKYGDFEAFDALWKELCDGKKEI